MKKKLTPMKAIRLKCLDYCLGQPNEVRECPFFPFRFGKNPTETPYYDDGVSQERHDAMRAKTLERLRKNAKTEGAGD